MSLIIRVITIRNSRKEFPKKTQGTVHISPGYRKIHTGATVILPFSVLWAKYPAISPYRNFNTSSLSPSLFLSTPPVHVPPPVTAAD